MEVNKKTRLRVPAELRPAMAAALKVARKSLGLSQGQLAETLGSSQDAVSRWERAIDSPPIPAVAVLAQLVPESQKKFWLDAGGIAEQPPAVHSDLRDVPVLRDSAAAGTPRAIAESEVDYVLSLPHRLVPSGGKLYGLKVEGDSMSPILETGYIALVDVEVKKMSQLAGKMVAARAGDGVTIKWLRKQHDDLYLLVPQKTSPRHQIQLVRPDGDWSVIGEVVMWIGCPPATKLK